jgi:hypothetical protein
VKAPPEACPSCGTPVGPGHEYCLECGARIVPAPRVSSVGRAWERKLGRYPGDWIWASLVLLLVAAGSATAGIVAARDPGAGPGSETLVATSPVVSAPPVTTLVTPPPPRTTTNAPTRSRPKTRSALIEWPARDGFTIVIASIPARGTGLKDANATAKEVVARGLSEVGVLVSSRFASLHPGYYVVFAGIYSSLEDAQTAVSRVTSKFPNAYARQITR